MTSYRPKKLRDTITIQRPISGTPKSNADYNFVFSSDIADWQGTKKKRRDQNYEQRKQAK